MAIQDLAKIIKESWGDMNPAQRLAIMKKVYSLRKNDANEKLLKDAKTAYTKWKLTVNYQFRLRGVAFE